MTVQELMEMELFRTVNPGDDLERQITEPFCCDLLSVAMSRAPEGCAWVTVMANINTLAVASLADAACVILAEGVTLPKDIIDTANSKGVNILGSELPAYEIACLLYESLKK